jgi:hypothetical protein
MRLLIQDDIIDKMDVYVDYTIDTDDDGYSEVVLFDYGLELTGRTVINGLQGREVITTTADTSLRGYNDTRWMDAELVAYIEHEEGLNED